MRNNKAERQRQIIERLARDTWMRVESLNRIAKSYPELVIPIARKQIVWPGFISCKRAFQKKNAELMETIQLGKESDYSEGEWQPNAPSTRAAYWLHWLGRLKKAEWELPKLTKNNKRTWFNKVWRCVIEELHLVPEKHPLLSRLSGSVKTPPVMRAQIKRQTWKAFDALIRSK